MPDFVVSLAYIAGVLMLIGFASHRESWIRTFTIFASVALLPYYYLIANVPLWEAIIATLALIAVNGFMLWKASRDDKPVYRLSAEEMMLFARLPGVTPGQFRKLLDIAAWHNPKSTMPLTSEGEAPDALYYVLEGQVNVARGQEAFHVGPHAFIGELAFLRGRPATATTMAEAGALIVAWPQAKLRNLMQKDDGVRKVIDNVLSMDLAEKIVRTSMPVLQEQSARGP